MELDLLDSDVYSNIYVKIYKPVNEIAITQLFKQNKYTFTGKHNNLLRIYSIPKLHKSHTNFVL